MELVTRYQEAVKVLLDKAANTQKDKIEEVGNIVAKCVENGGHVYLSSICHSIESDLLYRGGGPIFYKHYEEEKTELKPGDVLFVSSVSGRTLKVVNLAYDSVQNGVTVIAFTSMSYAVAVDPVHPSGKKLYEIATVTVDNCAPSAEAMLEVEGIEAHFAAASGIASDFLMWSITSACVETMLKDGYTPGILKSANFPGGDDYNRQIIEPHYEKYGW